MSWPAVATLADTFSGAVVLAEALWAGAVSRAVSASTRLPEWLTFFKATQIAFGLREIVALTEGLGVSLDACGARLTDDPWFQALPALLRAVAPAATFLWPSGGRRRRGRRGRPR